LNSEHTIDNINYDGEMIVHHTAEDGTKADVSFMISINPESDDNEFFDNLEPYRWNFRPFESIELQSSPNLN